MYDNVEEIDTRRIFNDFNRRNCAEFRRYFYLTEIKKEKKTSKTWVAAKFIEIKLKDPSLQFTIYLLYASTVIKMRAFRYY